MATTKAAARTAAQTAAQAASRANPFEVFVWEGTDKRGTKIKGE